MLSLPCKFYLPPSPPFKLTPPFPRLLSFLSCTYCYLILALFPMRPPSFCFENSLILKITHSVSFVTGPLRFIFASRGLKPDWLVAREGCSRSGSRYRTRRCKKREERSER